MSTATAAALATASVVAEDVLFPRAVDVDRGRADVRDNLDALADAGLYGLHAPTDVGGLGADPRTAGLVTEALAGGCLTTAFAWIQHQGVVKRIAGVPGLLADHWLPRLAGGTTRAAVAVGGVRPGRALLTATAVGDDWRLDGTVPWVTGWGLTDVVLTAARVGEDGRDVLWLLLDSPPVADPAGAMHSGSPNVTLRRVSVAACDRANSAVVTLDGLEVPGARVVARQTDADWRAADAAGLRGNGSLPLGVATRCARLLASSGEQRASAALEATVDDVRGLLDDAGTDDLPRARAVAADLAWHAAQRLLVAVGGSGIGTGAHPQRLAREALFLQVFGSRPSIRDAHLRLLQDR